MSIIWVENTLKALGNVEKGLKTAHDSLDELQSIVDQAREAMSAGDHDQVQLYIKQINSALGMPQV